MPHYEVLCEKCKKPFELTMTISEREKAKPKYPACKGTKVVPQFSGFMAQTAKKSRPRDPQAHADDRRARGESAAEWQALENCVQLGQRTSGSRADESRLLQIVAALRAPLREEVVAVRRARASTAATCERKCVEAGVAATLAAGRRRFDGRGYRL
jgi:putative FmdB family regulatory protein